MLLRLLLTLLVLPFAPFLLLRRWLGRPRGRWVELRLGPAAVEIDADVPRWRMMLAGVRKPPTRIDRVRELVEAIAGDPAREGLLVRIEGLTVGWATTEALREALAPLRAAGKKTVAYLPRGATEKELFVALACDRVVTSPPAMFLLPGQSSGGLYAGALLAKLGVRFERFARSEFKTAYESLERTSMSDGQRVQVGALLEGIGRALDAAHAERSVNRAELLARGLFDADDAKSLGLVSDVLYEDELRGHLGLETKREKLIPAGRYYGYVKARLFPKLFTPPLLAVIRMDGVIGDAGPASRVGSAIAALRIAARDRRAKAIVLYVDSPGGSAFGSDLVHREVVLAKKHKPVVACFGDVAASGGYYVAAPADAIVARPLTVTGSIGVVAARPSLDGLVHKLGLVRETIGDAPHATLVDPTRPLDEASRAAFERSLDSSYARFVGIVAEGRARDRAEVEPLARGRVYLGSDAAGLGLVDGLGGFPEARTRAEALARAKHPKLKELVPVVVSPPRGAHPPPLDNAPSALAKLLRGLSELFAIGTGPAYLAPELVDFGAPVDLGLSHDRAPGLWSLPGALRTMRIPLLSLALFAVSQLGCGPSLSHVHPGPMPEHGTFHGVWFSPQYGDMHLCQSNENVVGEYTKQERHGTIRGTVEGNMLRFQWHEEREIIPGRPVVNDGHGYFVVSRDQNGLLSIDGKWGFGADEVGGGTWTAVMQERQTPDHCYDSIRRTVPPTGAPSSDEVRFPDESGGASGTSGTN